MASKLIYLVAVVEGFDSLEVPLSMTCSNYGQAFSNLALSLVTPSPISDIRSLTRCKSLLSCVKSLSILL